MTEQETREEVLRSKLWRLIQENHFMRQEAKKMSEENRKLNAAVVMAEHQREAALSGAAARQEFLRGAAAMREIAANAAWDTKRTSAATKARVEEMIRELPLPEFE